MRLIDADALEYHKQLEAMGNGQYEEVKVVYECDIDNAPTIDAEPVKHGEWKYYNFSDINNPYVGWYECTVCKHHEYSERDFCPNCGADMRGDKHEVD